MQSDQRLMQMTELSLEIDYANTRHGWITCWLTIDGTCHRLDASCNFPPFLELLYFVKAVAGNRLPAKYFLNEEGFGADFFASPVPGSGDILHLKIVHWDDGDETWLDAVLDKETVVHAFLTPLLDMARNFKEAESEWFFPPERATMVAEAIAWGIPPRSDIRYLQKVYFNVQGDYKTRYVHGHIFIYVWLEEELTFNILLHDTDPFWPGLIEFMSRIASGKFPAECRHERFVDHSSLLSGDKGYRNVTRFEAEALEVPENFRLKIYVDWYNDGEFLLLEEVVEREWFVGNFADSLRELLEGDYKVCPDEDGKTFDLGGVPDHRHPVHRWA